jgi:hypothetical protein
LGITRSRGWRLSLGRRYRSVAADLVQDPELRKSDLGH